MKRLFAAALAALTLAATAQAQHRSGPYKIGVISFGVAASSTHLESFRQGMRDLGYAEGKNLVLELRFAEGYSDRLPRIAAELARLKMDVIVTEGVPTALAARQAAKSTPIVMAGGADPVQAGLAASLARPGGTITGLTFTGASRTGKQLQLLKEILPQLTSVVAIYNPLRPDIRQELDEARETARALGLGLSLLEVRTPEDLTQALDTVRTTRAQGMITIGHGMLLGNSGRIGAFAANNRVPAAFPEREFAEAGGLIAYGPDIGWNFRRAALYVDRILKGAKPADLPIERPTKWGLVLNLRTAKALGITIPQSFLVRADEIIE